MARVVLGESSIRARRLRRRALSVAAFFLFVVLLLVGTIFLARVSFLRVTRVEVLGSQSVAASDLQQLVLQELEDSYFFVFPKSNVFLYPKKAIVAKLLASYPSLKGATTNIKDFQSITVTVEERHPEALWCSDLSSSPCFFLDGEGVIYAQAPAYSAPVYDLYLGTAAGKTLPRQFLLPGQFRALSALVAAVRKDAGIAIERVSVDAHDDVRMWFANGFVLLFVLKEAGGDVYERFTLALGSEPFKNRKFSDFEYLDLRFGDKLYYKLKL